MAVPDRSLQLIDTFGRNLSVFKSGGYKRILLLSIFGVDIDPQAVEVTKLSLLLKVLEGESDQSVNAQLKLKPKTANVAGLQLADLLVKPIKNMVLADRGQAQHPPSSFEERLVAVVKAKLNHHLYDGRVEGYGTVFFPK